MEQITGVVSWWPMVIESVAVDGENVVFFGE